MAKQPAERVAEIAAEALPEIVEVLSRDAASLNVAYKEKTVERRSRLRYHSMFEGRFNAPDAPERFEAPDSWETINTLLYRRGWTDGLPIVPPTPERFEKMLADGGWQADERLGLIEPQLGQATVGKVAANAILAGCGPEHLPVVVAATRAMARPELDLKALQTTTHSCTVLALVNGPIVEVLDINASYNAMGQGVMSNATIGRAVRFVLINIGGASPGVLDRSTMGSPAKYAFCFAENTEASPWEPLNVERGFEAEQSTVTVAGVEGPHNVNDHYARCAEEVLLSIAGVMATPGANNSYLRGEILVVLGPEHAEIIARDGLTKADVKRFLLEHAIIPVHHISEAAATLMRNRVPEGQLGPDGRDGFRILSRPEEVMLVVAGGAGRHSQVIHSFGRTQSVTVPVLDAAGKPL